MKTLVVDLDGTITIDSEKPYDKKDPNQKVINKLQAYRDMGFTIIINTARNMRTFEGDVSKINTETVPVALDWLMQHNVPYDGLLVGKPWCGLEGFYIDDRAIRPSEFINNSLEQIQKILLDEQQLKDDLP